MLSWDEIPQPGPGEHAVILPDTQAHLDAARVHLTCFLPDVNFRPDEAVGRWPYVTIVGNTNSVTAGQEAALRDTGAWVERVNGQTNCRHLGNQVRSEAPPWGCTF